MPRNHHNFCNNSHTTITNQRNSHTKPRNHHNLCNSSHTPIDKSKQIRTQNQEIITIFAAKTKTRTQITHTHSQIITIFGTKTISHPPIDKSTNSYKQQKHKSHPPIHKSQSLQQITHTKSQIHNFDPFHWSQSLLLAVFLLLSMYAWEEKQQFFRWAIVSLLSAQEDGEKKKINFWQNKGFAPPPPPPPPPSPADSSFRTPYYTSYNLFTFS